MSSGKQGRAASLAFSVVHLWPVSEQEIPLYFVCYQGKEMKKFIVLLLISLCGVLWGCDKTVHEERAEKSAKERADRNRADHQKRSE